MRSCVHAIFFMLLAVLFTSNANAFVVSASCKKKIDVSQFMKTGVPEDTPPDKIYRFVKVRDEFTDSLDQDTAKAKCLGDMYQAGLNEEGEYWGRKLARMGCQLNSKGEVTGGCDMQSEAVKSTKFISNLEDEFSDDMKDLVSDSREARAAAIDQVESGAPVATAPACKLQSLAQVALDAKNNLCCGSPSFPSSATDLTGGGAIRGIEPKLSYSQCLTKTKPSTHGVAAGIGMCAVNAVTGALKMILDSLTSIFKLPGQLWGARSQIYKLMTDASARTEFANKIQAAISQFINDRITAVGSCYNGYEKAQFTCKTVGQIVGALAAPNVIGSFIGLASKPLMAASKAIGLMLADTKAGVAILKGVSASARAAKDAAEAARAAAKARVPAPVGAAANLAGRGAKAAIKGVRATARASERLRNRIARLSGLPQAAERLALAVARSGAYRKAVQAAYRAEQAAMARARNATVRPVTLAEVYTPGAVVIENASHPTNRTSEVAVSLPAQNLSPTALKASERLQRKLTAREVEAVDRTHAICGQGPGISGVFSQSCKIQKAFACRRVLSRAECQDLLDQKILGNFSEPPTSVDSTPKATSETASSLTPNVDAELDEMASLDAWSRDFQTSRTLRAEDRTAIEKSLESAMESLGEGRSARDALDEIKRIRTLAAGRKPAVTGASTATNANASAATQTRVVDINHDYVKTLKPNTATSDLASPGYHDVTMSPDVVKFMQSTGSEGVRFAQAIRKGFVGQTGQSGVVRYNSVSKNFVEVKVLASGVKHRILGCVKNGTLELLHIFEKHGDDSANYSRKYHGLCN